MYNLWDIHVLLFKIHDNVKSNLQAQTSLPIGQYSKTIIMICNYLTVLTELIPSEYVCFLSSSL